MTWSSTPAAPGRGTREYDDLDVREVGIAFERRVPDRVRAPGDERDHADRDEERVAGRAFDDSLQHRLSAPRGSRDAHVVHRVIHGRRRSLLRRFVLHHVVLVAAHVVHRVVHRRLARRVRLVRGKQLAHGLLEVALAVDQELARDEISSPGASPSVISSQPSPESRPSPRAGARSGRRRERPRPGSAGPSG